MAAQVRRDPTSHRPTHRRSSSTHESRETDESPPHPPRSSGRHTGAESPTSRCPTYGSPPHPPAVSIFQKSTRRSARRAEDLLVSNAATTTTTAETRLIRGPDGEIVARDVPAQLAWAIAQAVADELGEATVCTRPPGVRFWRVGPSSELL